MFTRLSPRLLPGRLNDRRSILESGVFALSTTFNPFRGWTPDYALVESIPYIQLPLLTRVLNDRSIRFALDVNEAWVRGSGEPGLRDSRFTISLVRRSLRHALESAEAITVTSKVTRESLIRNYGVSSNRILLVPDGIPENMGTTEGESIKNQDRAGRPFDFVMLGRLDRIKRHSDFIRALNVLREYGWTGRAVIIGGGSEESTLRREASSLGLGPQLLFTGTVTSEQRNEYLHLSRVYVLCSAREGFSRSTLEALAHGLPAIVARPTSSEVFGVSDLVFDFYNGLYYPVRDIHALSNAMKKLIDDEGLRSQMSQAALQVATKFRWRDIAASFADHISTVVGESRHL